MTDIYSMVASSWGLLSKIDSGVCVILGWPHCNCCLPAPARDLHTILPDWKHSSRGYRELQVCWVFRMLVFLLAEVAELDKYLVDSKKKRPLSM